MRPRIMDVHLDPWMRKGVVFDYSAPPFQDSRTELYCLVLNVFIFGMPGVCTGLLMQFSTYIVGVGTMKKLSVFLLGLILCTLLKILYNQQPPTYRIATWPCRQEGGWGEDKAEYFFATTTWYT